jgi:hypothetical protein
MERLNPGCNSNRRTPQNDEISCAIAGNTGSSVGLGTWSHQVVVAINPDFLATRAPALQSSSE